MIQEEWANINGYEGLYLISNLGRVMSLPRGKKTSRNIKSTYIGNKGYEQVGLSGNGNYRTLRIHRLVAEAFISNPEKKEQVNHIDGVKTNNCVLNLEWNTNQENRNHAKENGLIAKGETHSGLSGENHGRSKLTEKQVLKIRELFNSGNYTKESLSKQFGVSRINIYRIVTNKLWKHI